MKSLSQLLVPPEATIQETIRIIDQLETSLVDVPIELD